MARQCLKPKRKRDATWFMEIVLLVKAQGNGKVLNEEELEFLADPDIIKAVQDTNSSAQQDALILFVSEQLSNQVTNYNKVNKDNLISNKTLSAELERYKERVKLLEESQNVDLGESVCHNSIKNDLRKGKGKDIVVNVSQMSNATTIAPGMSKPSTSASGSKPSGVDLLSGSQGTNLYSLSIGDMMTSSLICLFSKARKTKSWLWHRRVSHLNFVVINPLARHILVRGLPKHKFEKDHLCFACAMGKSKKQSHTPKSKDTNHEKLYLLHIDLYGPMHVSSVNRKKYILIIVDDYSRFTWVKFLASKDEALDFIIKFLKMIQVRLNATVRNIRTDNETEFVNQTPRDYYEQVVISHETSVARTPQQNGVVERQNRTLVKATYTIIIETIHVDFDELTVMASAQLSSGLGLQYMTPATPSSGLILNPPLSALFVPPSSHEWDLVFQPVFDELFSPVASVASPVPVKEAPAHVESIRSPSSTTIDQDAPSPIPHYCSLSFPHNATVQIKLTPQKPPHYTLAIP
uniref:Retrovirus-related Pol polyprotein from transposon TNT 1-94 n=1 Tax=Tanacetum cinerariifolium TaxID=118510 RepID=A0A699HJ20_TANCI|nr:retrovirus-related Pol polyprotein from transposon TNT 1-94 [Tanacetum cinerariifolium]